MDNQQYVQELERRAHRLATILIQEGVRTEPAVKMLDFLKASKAERSSASNPESKDQGAMHRILSRKPETVFIDKFGGAQFTAGEIARLVAPMIATDTKEDIDAFCERFVERDDSRHCLHWVCRSCIGNESFAEYTVGLIGQRECEVCGDLLPQPPLALVSNDIFIDAMGRKSCNNPEQVTNTQQFGTND